MACTNPVAQVDFNIYQGDDYLHSFIWQDDQGTPIDLTGYSARLQVRRKASDTEFILEITDLDGITLGGVAGTVDIQIPGAETAKITKASVYDLELTDASGTVITLTAGNVCIFQEVTR